MAIYFPIFTIIGRVLACTLVLLSAQSTAVHAQAGSPPLLISEVQTGSIANGIEDPKGEFVEIYNPLAHEVSLAGWRIDFLTKTHDGSSQPTRILATFGDTIIAPGGQVIASYDKFIPNADAYFTGGTSSGYLAKGDGTVRLVDSGGTIIDMIGWGAPNHYESQPASAPNAGQSLQRCVAASGLITDTANNFNDFQLHDQASPGAITLCQVQQPDPTTEPCDNIMLSEILPNASGTDDGKEFIEIHNPASSEVKLAECTLRLGESGPAFELPDIVLGAGEYRAFFDSATGITLPNSTGETVWLLTSSNEEGVRYADGLADDQSWSLIDGAWKATFTPTPGQPNSFSEAGKGSGEALASCEPGQERNSDTNRCRKIATAIANCKPGQERNQVTNRCRSVVTTASTLIPCKPGQTRNPETNRCRSVSTSASLKSCEPGQDRNPEANRCRKISTGTQLGTIHDVPTSQTGSTMGWWLAGAGAVGATGYGMYEWRRELAAMLGRLKDKFLPPGSAS